MKTFSFIFARGGSKGIKNKNIKSFCGKPLIEYSIKAAKEIDRIDECFVSTDSLKIAKVSKKLGAKIILRPSQLAQDNSSEWLAWQHAIRTVYKSVCEFDIFISLPTTSPLRTKINVEQALDNLKSNVDIVMTVNKTNHHPSFNMVKKNKNNLISIFDIKEKEIYQRQKVQNIFNLNTVAYVSKPEFILNNTSMWNGRVYGLEIDRENSIDIDDEFDFKVAENLMKERLKIV